MMSALIQPAFAQQEPAFQNGPSTLQETYQDWLLSCTIGDTGRGCVLLQDQSRQNGQRLLAVEIAMRPDGAVATLLLPFGILLDSGVTPQIDDQAPLQPLRFRTCLPNGCVAFFPMGEAFLNELRAGSALNLTVMTATESAMTFPVSLNGITAALERLRSLSEG